MWLAFLTGLLGILLTGILGRTLFMMDSATIIRLLVITFFSGLYSSLTVLALERRAWIKKHILGPWYTQWAWLVLFYFLPIILSNLSLFTVKSFLILAIPLVMVSGMVIQIFGPIQDQIYHSIQRASRKKSESKG